MRIRFPCPAQAGVIAVPVGAFADPTFPRASEALALTVGLSEQTADYLSVIFRIVPARLVPVLPVSSPQ